MVGVQQVAVGIELGLRVVGGAVRDRQPAVGEDSRRTVGCDIVDGHRPGAFRAGARATYSRRFAEPLICTGSVTAAVVKLSPPRSWNDESAKNFGPSAMAAPAVTWAISRDTSPRISAWTPSETWCERVRTATLLDGQTAVMSTGVPFPTTRGAQVETLSRHTGPRELSAEVQLPPCCCSVTGPYCSTPLSMSEPVVEPGRSSTSMRGAPCRRRVVAVADDDLLLTGLEVQVAVDLRAAVAEQVVPPADGERRTGDVADLRVALIEVRVVEDAFVAGRQKPHSSDGISVAGDLTRSRSHRAGNVAVAHVVHQRPRVWHPWGR